MIRNILIAGLALGVSACSASRPGAESTTNSHPNAAASACAARNGEIKQVGRLQSWRCVINYADAGKRCTGAAQCQGECLLEGNSGVAPGTVPAGVCQATSDRFGCSARVEGGKAGLALCID